MSNAVRFQLKNADQPVVMLVDDDAAVLNFARITLEREGYFILTAQNGEEALHLSRQYRGEIDILLTVIKMPKMSGTVLSRRISAERPGTRIVLMSGHAFEEPVNPKFPLLEKPFGPKQLSETIGGLILKKSRRSGA
jgi:two-component system, cell cycle sensor histidine kinase and response regulator CckA